MGGTRGTGRGHRLDGTQLCVSNSTCNATTCGDDPIGFTAIDACIQDANVTVAKASAEKSLLLGSGAVKDGRIVAGTEVSLAVVAEVPDGGAAVVAPDAAVAVVGAADVSVCARACCDVVVVVVVVVCVCVRACVCV